MQSNSSNCKRSLHIQSQNVEKQSCFFAPIPPTPFPAGRGRLLVFLCKGLRPLHPRGLNPGGTGEGWRLTRPEGGTMALVAGLFPTLAVLLPPSPLPPFPAGRGRLLVYFAGGWRPRHPCIKPFAALTAPAYWYPAQRSLLFSANSTEIMSLERCRQPRRGGTGGDGTIRRKRRRRLRWSSPPGQG